MPARTTGLAQPSPQRSRLPAPALPSRRGELTAALATAGLLAELVLAPVTVALAGSLFVAGRLGRWRPPWLAGPAAAGLAWISCGPRSAISGFTAGPRALVATASGAGRLAHLPAVVHWLPGQLPVALLAGAAEAGVALWLGPWRRARGSDWWRPGLAAIGRRRAAVTALAAGRTVTASGCALGVETATGRLAGLSWAEAERSVLVASTDPAVLPGICLPVACAALRRRKAVVVADLSASGALAAATAGLTRSLGVPLQSVPLQSVPDPADLTPVLGQMILHREAVFAGPRHAGPAAAAVSGLVQALAGLRDLGLRGDTLAWIHGCESADPSILGQLIELGPQTGTAVLLSTAAGAAGRLAGAVAIVVAAAPVGHDLAVQLAAAAATWPGEAGRQEVAAALLSRPAGTFTILAPRRARQVLVHAAAVPPMQARLR
jgi:hypothetical protein